MSLQAKLAALLVLIVALAGSHWYVFNLGQRMERADWVLAQDKADEEATVKYNAIAQQLEEAKNARHIVTRTITKQVDKIVDRPVYRNICLEPDGLQLINRALTGTGSSESAATVPAAATP